MNYIAFVTNCKSNVADDFIQSNDELPISFEYRHFRKFRLYLRGEASNRSNYLKSVSCNCSLSEDMK